MQLHDILAMSDDRVFWKTYGHLGDSYMKSRRKAEHVAQGLALQCEEEGHRLFSRSIPMKITKGEKFLAVGLWDVRNGIQFFALDYATPEERADVDAWIEDFQMEQFA